MTDPETTAGLPVTQAELQAMRDWQPHRFEDVQAKLERMQRRLEYAVESKVIDETAYWEILGKAGERVQAVMDQQAAAPPRPA